MRTNPDATHTSLSHFRVAPSLCFKARLSAKLKCEAVNVKMVFSHANKTHLHKKGFALSLVLKEKVLETRK